MGGGAPSPLPNGKTKMTLRNLIPQKPEVKMSSRELTGCNKRPSDRLEASWFPGGFLTGFSGDNLETEARRIGEIKEARFLENPICQSGIYQCSSRLWLCCSIWSRDLEKSLENEQKKLQEEKKRNEELQKDAKDGVEEPGGPHEDDEKAQNCRCCLIAVMAEGKTFLWRMHEIMKLWNILVRHLWWSYKYHKDSLNISFQVDFGRTLKFLTILDIFGCLFVRMQRWLTLVLLSHGCSSMSRSPSFNTATQMLLRKMQHSWAFSITLRTVWKLWKMKMQNFRMGWRAMKFSNNMCHVNAFGRDQICSFKSYDHVRDRHSKQNYAIEARHCFGQT